MSKDKEISGVNEPKKVGKNLGCLHFKIFLPDYFLLLEINENCDTDTDNIDDIYFLEKLDLISRFFKISKHYVAFFRHCFSSIYIFNHRINC